MISWSDLARDTAYTYRTYAAPLRRYGVANLGLLGSVVSAGLNGSVNLALVSGTLDAGIAVGSAIRPLYLPNFGSCGAI